jgi:AcrR family transcriptional regulator
MGRHKLVEDDELLAVAREVFIDKGVTASTREIARLAGISEAVIYQRHPTKAHLFFAAMAPPALNVEQSLSAPANEPSVLEQLEEIALALPPRANICHAAVVIRSSSPSARGEPNETRLIRSLGDCA